MAYLKNLQTRCDLCHRKATQALYSVRNAHLGDYCGPCGRHKLREAEAREHALSQKKERNESCQ